MRPCCASENRAFEFALLLTMPAAIALYLAAEPIVRVLFQRGAFTAIDTNATASMLAALALGLPAYVLIKVLQPSFFAREDTKTPMVYAGIAMAANVVLSIMLFTMHRRHRHRHRHRALGLDQRRPAASPRIGAARASASIRSFAAASWGIARRKRPDGCRRVCAGATARSAGSTRRMVCWSKLWRIGALVGLGLLTYLGAAHLFGAANFRDLIKDQAT